MIDIPLVLLCEFIVVFLISNEKIFIFIIDLSSFLSETAVSTDGSTEPP